MWLRRAAGPSRAAALAHSTRPTQREPRAVEAAPELGAAPDAGHRPHTHQRRPHRRRRTELTLPSHAGQVARMARTVALLLASATALSAPNGPSRRRAKITHELRTATGLVDEFWQAHSDSVLETLDAFRTARDRALGRSPDHQKPQARLIAGVLPYPSHAQPKMQADAYSSQAQLPRGKFSHPRPETSLIFFDIYARTTHARILPQHWQRL